MDIRLNIEMRCVCARRRNDAAYQRHRRRSVTGRHAIIIHRRHMEYRRSPFPRFEARPGHPLMFSKAATLNQNIASWNTAKVSSLRCFYVQQDVMHANPKSSAGCVHVERKQCTIEGRWGSLASLSSKSLDR